MLTLFMFNQSYEMWNKIFVFVLHAGTYNEESPLIL